MPHTCALHPSTSLQCVAPHCLCIRPLCCLHYCPTAGWAATYEHQPCHPSGDICWRTATQQLQVSCKRQVRMYVFGSLALRFPGWDLSCFCLCVLAFYVGAHEGPGGGNGGWCL